MQPATVLRPPVAGLLVAALALAVPALAQNEPEDFGVFLPVDSTGADVAGRALRPLPADPLVIRERRVGIDLEALAPLTAVLERGAALPALRLNLFEDVVVESLVESVDSTASGYSWSGGVAGDALGSVAMAVNHGAVSGIVRTRGRVYTIRSDGSGQYVIREVDRSGLPEGAPPLVMRPVTVDPMPAAFVDDAGRVDVAVFYTRAARQDAGGEEEIHALIDAWIADTNGAYLRSDIHHRLNLVLREEVSYKEGEDSEENPLAEQALECLAQEDDDCLDDIHDRREEYSADLVHLIVSTSVTEYPRVCGIAYLAGSFGVSHLDCGSNTFAHEVGHNSGATHDRYVEYDEECDTDPDVPCFEDFPSAYAYGYVNQYGLDPDAPYERRWRTLMSYGDQCADDDVFCQQVMRFSNPEQSWYGDDLGVHGSSSSRSYRDAADAARRGPADAARTHREFAHDLANRMVREAPDLTLKGIKTNRSQAEPKALVHLSAVVFNQGIATVDDPDIEVKWCRARGKGCGASVGEPSPVPALEANSRALVSTSFKLPSSRGSYSYRACVSDALGETLTENNCSEPVTVDAGTVDLEFSMSLSRSSVQAGAEVEIKGTVRNRGTIQSGVGELVFAVRDPDGEVEVVDRHLFQTIAAGRSASFTTAFEAPDVAGDYLYAACLLSSHTAFDCAQETLTVRSSVSPSNGWTAKGEGSNFVDIPDSVLRFRIRASYTGSSENFVVWCGSAGTGGRGGLLVNEILGTFSSNTTYTGVHENARSYSNPGEPCRVLHVTHSTGVSWEMTAISSR